MTKEEIMEFYCKNCNKEFEVDDKECEGYYNWKCPDCLHIANKKDMALGLGIIWKTDTGTVSRSCYGDTQKSNSKCASCPNAN